MSLLISEPPKPTAADDGEGRCRDCSAPLAYYGGDGTSGFFCPHCDPDLDPTAYEADGVSPTQYSEWFIVRCLNLLIFAVLGEISEALDNWERCDCPFPHQAEVVRARIVNGCRLKRHVELILNARAHKRMVLADWAPITHTWREVQADKPVQWGRLVNVNEMGRP